MATRKHTRASRRSVISAVAPSVAGTHFRKAARIAEAAAGCFPVGGDLGEPSIPRQRLVENVRLAIAALDEGHDALAESWDAKDDLHATVFEVADLLYLVEHALDAGATFDDQDMTNCPPRGGLKVAARLLERLCERIEAKAARPAKAA